MAKTTIEKLYKALGAVSAELSQREAMEAAYPYKKQDWAINHLIDAKQRLKEAIDDYDKYDGLCVELIQELNRG